MNIARIKRCLWQALSSLTVGVVCCQPANADFVDGSCSISVRGSSWIYSDVPASPPAGFVIAQRGVLGSISFRKTGNVMDTLEIGGAWQAYGFFNQQYRAATIPDLPGVGIRFSELTLRRNYYSEEVYWSSSRNTGPRDTGFSVSFVMELVIIDPKRFKGGTATRVNGMPFFIVSSSFSKRNPGLRPVCNAGNTIPEGEVLSIGGGEPLKPIPPPSAPTCTASTENLNFSVDLPPIAASSLKAVGDLSAGTARNLVLTDCGANATPYVTFTDNNDRSNRTTNLTLSADSKASGVGIRLISGDHTVQLGAQDTTVSDSNVGQFLLGTSTADGSTLSLPLQVHYVRTGPVVPGRLKAAAIVTIVYP